MGTSFVHVLTIIGKAAVEMETACEELLGRRIERSPTSYSTLDWTDQDHKDLEQFCVTLVKASRALPILYYAQYLDPWTVADSMFRLLKWPDGRRRQICGAEFGLAFYPSRFSSELLAEIEMLRIAELYRARTKDRWYLDHVKEAIDAPLWLQDRFLVVAISDSIAPSRRDEDVKAALNMSIELNAVQ